MLGDPVPASPERGEMVAIHWSRRHAGLGLMITRQGNRFGVWNIAPVMGRLTARMFDLVATEPDARDVANSEWALMGL